MENELQRLQMLSQQAREKGLTDQPTVNPLAQKNEIAENKEGSAVSLEEAEKIFGKDFFGPKQIYKVFGSSACEGPIEEIPFSRGALEQAQRLNQQLIYQVQKMDNPAGGAPGNNSIYITPENLINAFPNDSEGRPFWNTNNLNESIDSDFFTEWRPRSGWKLVSKEILSETFNKNYLQQNDVLVNYLKAEVFFANELPLIYKDAIDSYKKKRPSLEEIAGIFDTKAASFIQSEDITKMLRETPVEVLYRIILNEKINNQTLFYKKCTTTNAIDKEGGFIDISTLNTGQRNFIEISAATPNFAHPNYGACFSRME